MSDKILPTQPPPSEPCVVVTGVSSGIGAAIVHLLLSNGYRVFGSVRSKQDRKQAVREFGTGFVPLMLDVTDERDIQAAASLLENALGGRGLDALVNNAGIALAGPSMELPVEVFRHQFEVNLFGQIAVTKALLPFLIGRGERDRTHSARIINISSVTGLYAPPFLAPYAASKHALEAWSDSLRRELLLARHNIDVVVIGPGPVKTPIWEKGQIQDLEAFSQTPYGAAFSRLNDYARHQGAHGMPTERVAKTVLSAITASNPKARYRLARGGFFARFLHCLPKRFVDRKILQRFGGDKP